MNLSKPVLALVAVSSLLGVSQLFVDPAVANEPPVAESFYCDTTGAVPVTKIRTVRGDETFIEWRNSFGKKYTRAQRCQTVTARFESRRGNMYLTSSGNVNGMPVICNVDQQGDKCNASNVLVTLENKTDHKATLQQFIAHQRGASSAKLRLNNPYMSDFNGNYYLNVGKMIDDMSGSQTKKPVMAIPAPLKSPTNSLPPLYRRY